MLNLPHFEPAHPALLRDRAVARLQDCAFSGVVLAALETVPDH